MMTRRALLATVGAVGTTWLTGCGGGGTIVPIPNQTGIISGRVTLSNENDAPLDGATVSLNTTPVMSATTDAQGAFQFASVPVGTYTLFVQKTGVSLDANTKSVQVAANSTADGSLPVSKVAAQPAASTLVLSKQLGVGRFGFVRYNAQNGQLIKAVEVSGARSTSQIIPLSDGSLLITANNTVMKYDPTDIPTAFSSAVETLQSIVLLPSGNVLGVHNSGYTVFNASNGTIIRQVSWATRRNFRGTAISPSGQLYTTTSENSVRRITRYMIGVGDVLTEDRVLVEDRNSDFYEMVFASDGNLLVSDRQNDQIRRFDINGSTLGGNFSARNILGALTIGRSIVALGDEVLFVSTNDGVIRVKYVNGTFTPIEQNVFLSLASDDANDLLVIPPR